MYARVKADGRLVKLNPTPVQEVDRLGFISHKWGSFYPGGPKGTYEYWSDEELLIYPGNFIRYYDLTKLEDARRDALDKQDWNTYHRLDDQIESAGIIPEQGIPGTVKYYTDYCSGYVKKLISPTRLLFEETGIYSGETIFTLRKSGHWVKQGQRISDGVRLILGWKHDYRCEEI